MDALFWACIVIAAWGVDLGSATQSVIHREHSKEFNLYTKQLVSGELGLFDFLKKFDFLEGVYGRRRLIGVFETPTDTSLDLGLEGPRFLCSWKKVHRTLFTR